MFLEKPLCKKCIPEHIARQKAESSDGNVSQSRAAHNARMLGINSMALNAF
jgi:hypothetical protein